ncbi:hypothetical protein HYW54_02965 [Candidatus Gottesmanbacteria bacterium]|nr:hypothetical protein [Candidatus Gottesmanbacteria bacterium]
MNKKILLLGLIIIIGGYLYYSSNKPIFNFSQQPTTNSQINVSEAVASKFDYLSQNGNSSCSLSFKDSIPNMADEERLLGSCCSPMSLHRYSEQVEGIKKYSHIPEIPPDPYDIEVGLAKKLLPYYDQNLTSSEQKAYDFAMQNSDEKGPCCCKCWRWYVYGGLGKYLIKNYKFTGEQLTEVWNFSDGCGGDSEHHHA